mmetsp:Transcript_45712/g.107746  ORF Transcript_45712/g.107746 Transcript_45712/m.107746 type:complete len:303 (-) Transcript_45712:73-981(-)
MRGHPLLLLLVFSTSQAAPAFWRAGNAGVGRELVLAPETETETTTWSKTPESLPRLALRPGAMQGDGGGFVTSANFFENAANRERYGTSTGGRPYFRPALFWQELLPDGHVCDGGLEFRVNLATGINECRFPTGGVEMELDPERLATAFKQQTAIVRNSKARDDTACLSRQILSAATWGDAALVGRLLRTCWITEAVALPALAEAAARGFTEVVAILLAAGVKPASVVPERPGGKNSLHLACEAGQEATAMQLLEAMSTPAEVGAKSTDGSTFVDLLRAQDMGGIARRLTASLAGRQLDAAL